MVYFGAPGARYACRRCARVAYYSQSEDAIDRMWRKQRKIEAKLERKGLHEKTKEKLWARWNEAEARKDRLFTLRMMPLMQRWGTSLDEILG